MARALRGIRDRVGCRCRGGAPRRAASAIGTSLPLLAPDDEEALLAEAGFKDVRLFDAGLAFRG